MALTIVGSAVSAAANNITLPAHAVGDILVYWAYRDGSATPPTTPTAGSTVPTWVLIDSEGGNTNSGNVRYAIATATNHTSGTWTNATGVCAVVLRGQDPTTPIGGHAAAEGTATTSMPGIAITPLVTDGTSQFLNFYAERNVTAWDAAPSGYTRLTSVATELCLNSKDDTTSDGAAAIGLTSSSSGGRFMHQLEIIAATAVYVRPKIVIPSAAAIARLAVR